MGFFTVMVLIFLLVEFDFFLTTSFRKDSNHNFLIQRTIMRCNIQIMGCECAIRNEK
jgi:hypothetical protein